MSKITVIGSTNIDYMGFSNEKLIYKDSNIGKVFISSGGVGRNICENLLRLQHEVTFLTCIGNDIYGKQMEKDLISLGCNIVKPLTDSPSASYLCINDENNDMILAVCDTRINEALNVSFISENEYLLSESEYVVLDGNLSTEVITYIVNKYSHKKLIADGISTAKVKKFYDLLDKFYLFKVNSLEYEIIKDASKPQYLIVSCGGKNIKYYDGAWKTQEVLKVTDIVSTTGCGDALLAGTISGLLKEYSFEDALKQGIELASKTLKVQKSVYDGK